MVTLIGILLAIALGFQAGARDRAGDATARSNLRIAMPAIEAYQADTGSYSGMTVAGLRAAYSPGVQGIDIVSADDVGYCIRATSAGRTWYTAGPGGDLTEASCS